MKLQLIKGRSYSGKGVSVTIDSPIYETDDGTIADALVGSGYFIVVESGKTNAGAGNNANKETPLEKMTAKQLDEYAKANGIDLKGLTKNADKIAKIQQTLNGNSEDGNNSAEGNGDNGGIDYDGGEGG